MVLASASEDLPGESRRVVSSVKGSEKVGVCYVAGVATPTKGSEIRFEVWLPSKGWNKKFMQVGNAGLGGTIPYADMVEPLFRGYAVASTDDGHRSTSIDGQWAIGHKEQVRDFGYRAVHLTSVYAKLIIERFYGERPLQSYFSGCSEGGREALIEAQRYPSDFQGIIAGAPASYFMESAYRFAWNAQAVQPTANGFDSASLRLLQANALKQCDSLDGIIRNPIACHPDTNVLRCKADDPHSCLNAEQIEAANKLYAPLLDGRSKNVIAPGYMPGNEGDPDGWALWIAPPKGGKSLDVAFSEGVFGGMVFEDPTWKVSTLNFAGIRDRRVIKLRESLNAIDPDLRQFKALGGKLLQYHGWGDAGISPIMSVQYFESVQEPEKESFYRLFMVPGMGHCSGGHGPDVFGNGVFSESPSVENDLEIALDRWVTSGVPPDYLLASEGTKASAPDGEPRTQLLCPYPKAARYNGSGKPEDASSFSCRLP